MTESRDRRKPSAKPIPDLDLPPPRPSRSGIRAVRLEEPRSQPPSRRPSGAPVYTLDEDELAKGPSLALELHAPISSGHVPQHPGTAELDEDRFELEPVPGAQAVHVNVDVGVAWPTGGFPESAKLQIDAGRVREFAAYGPAPDNLLLMPAYSLKVALRRRALVAQLKGVDRALSGAQARRERLLADLVEGLRPELEGSEAFQKLLLPVSELARLSGERGAALASAESEFQTELQRYDAQIAGFEQELEHEAAQGVELRQALELTGLAVTRAEAKHKRCFIEIRSVEQRALSRGCKEGEALPPDLAAELLPLRQSAEGLGTELAEARRAHESALRAEAEREARERELRNRIQSSKQEKSEHAVRRRRALDLDGQSYGEAESARVSALAEVGRAVLKARGRVPVDAAARKAVAEADARLFALAHDSELGLRALDACDAEKVRQGWVVIGAIGLCAVSLLAFLAFR